MQTITATKAGQGALQRITLITDESLEKMMIDEALKLGAEGYICSYCSGKPLHHAFERPNNPQLLVRIEVLAPLSAAEAIVEYIQQLQGRHYPVTAVMDSVTACP